MSKSSINTLNNLTINGYTLKVIDSSEMARRCGKDLYDATGLCYKIAKAHQTLFCIMNMDRSVVSGLIDTTAMQIKDFSGMYNKPEPKVFELFKDEFIKAGFTFSATIDALYHQ